jgi:L-2-hydroxyglutarate oxidase
VAALRVESAGIIDYRGVSEVMAAQIRSAGGDIRFGARVRAIRADDRGVSVDTDDGRIRADYLVNCAGL